MDGPTDPPTMSDGEIIERLEGDAKRLQAIVDKLPKTADGVPVVPGMVLYSSHFICGHFRSPEIVVALVAYANEAESEWMSGELDAETLYSTREAAESAKAAQEPESQST